MYNCLSRTANLPTNNLNFRGLDSSTILNLRGGMPRPIGNFPESLTQAILVDVMLVVGRLGVVQKTVVDTYVFRFRGKTGLASLSLQWHVRGTQSSAWK